jgi:hypothetical protein
MGSHRWPLPAFDTRPLPAQAGQSPPAIRPLPEQAMQVPPALVSRAAAVCSARNLA